MPEETLLSETADNDEIMTLISVQSPSTTEGKWGLDTTEDKKKKKHD